MPLREAHGVQVVREIRIDRFGFDTSADGFERLDARHRAGGAVLLKGQHTSDADSGSALWWVGNNFYRDSEGRSASDLERIERLQGKVEEIRLSLTNPTRTPASFFSRARVHLVIEHATGVANTTIPVQTWEAALQNPNPTCVARIAIGNIWAYAAGATPERYESKAENLWPSSFHVSVADPAVTEDDLLLLRYAPKPEPARFDRYETVDIWADGECIEVPVERFTEIEHSARGTISKIGNSGRRALWRVDEAYYWDADGRLSAEEVELTLWDAKRRREARFDRLRKIRARDEDADSYRRERIPDDVRSAVWARDEGRCVRCGAAEDLQFDHIIPVSRGGNASIDNIQILCGNCNRQKGNSIV